MSGVELAGRAGALRPDVKVLLTSGFPNAAISQDGELATGVQWIGKPYLKDDLARKVRAVLDG
jgi:hypothetical protein